MQNIPIDTLSDVSDSDSEAEKSTSSPPPPPPNALPQSPSDATAQGTSPSSPVQSCPRGSRHRRKPKRFKGDASLCADPEMTKWWKRRYDLFERFDDGIELDRESWYSVTPETIARHQAKTCACNLIIDGFAGVGGNSIQFAQTCAFVISIDNSMERLGLLQKNAAVYGAKSKIDAICGDLASVLSALRTGPLTPRSPSTSAPVEKPAAKEVSAPVFSSSSSSQEESKTSLHADVTESLGALGARSNLPIACEEAPGPADVNSSSGVLATRKEGSPTSPVADASPHTVPPEEENPARGNEPSGPSEKEILPSPTHGNDVEKSPGALGTTLARSDLPVACEEAPGPADTNPSEVTRKTSPNSRVAEAPHTVPEDESLAREKEPPGPSDEGILPPEDSAVVTVIPETGGDLELSTTNNAVVDVVFMSPPWGGQHYKERVLPPGAASWNRKRRKLWFETLGEEPEPFYNLNDIACLPGAVKAARQLTNRVVVYLPRNSAIGQLLALGWHDMTDSQRRVDVAIEDYWLRGRRLAVAAYVGDFADLETIAQV